MTLCSHTNDFVNRQSLLMSHKNPATAPKQGPQKLELSTGPTHSIILIDRVVDYWHRCPVAQLFSSIVVVSPCDWLPPNARTMLQNGSPQHAVQWDCGRGSEGSHALLSVHHGAKPSCECQPPTNPPQKIQSSGQRYLRCYSQWRDNGLRGTDRSKCVNLVRDDRVPAELSALRN